jgi:aminopeptidase
LKEYEDFVFNACNLYHDDPIAEWKKLSKRQQSIVNHLNRCTKVHYKGKDIDISFSTEGRTWINSDGKTNMPSGEVYTAPVEDSVNGVVRFSHPSIYMGTEVEDIRLEVKDGEVIKWDAKRGKEFLDQIFDIPGARRFGEAAVGTNFNIQQFTKNILFDEKIGGTIHMAIGQSYHQCGGKNNSSVHWDMIADMTNGGEIFADGQKVYENGQFTI